MSMFFDVAIVVVAGIFLWLGFKKGFFKSLTDLIILILSVLVPYLFAPTLAEKYYSTFVYNDLINKINDILTQNGAAINSAKNIMALLDKVPNFLKSDSDIFGVNLNDILKVLKGSANKSLVVADLLKPSIIQVLTVFMFAALALVTFIVLKLLFKFLFKLPKIPLFGLIDSILGLCMGALKFVVFMFIFIVVLKSSLLFTPQNVMLKDINKAIVESRLFGPLYNLNVDVLNDYLKLQ